MPALYLCSINEQVADITDAWKKRKIIIIFKCYSIFLTKTVL